MYQILLTSRYLTSKVMPLLAVVAVTLCTGLLITVWSIMGGFLTMLLEAGRRMDADVTISWPTTGFAHWEDLVSRLEQDPLVAAAAPRLEAFGMVTLPDGRVRGVQIHGVDGPSFARVTDFENTLWWKPVSSPLRRDRNREDVRLDDAFANAFAQLYQDGLSLTKFDPITNSVRPAAVAGIEVSGFSTRQPGGFYLPAGHVGVRTERGDIEWITGFLPSQSITVSVIPMSQSGRQISARSTRLPVANEFQSGIFELDQSTILMNLAELQRLLHMGEGLAILEDDFDPYDLSSPDGADEAFPAPPALGRAPSRVTSVLVRAEPGVTPEQLRKRCTEVYRAFAAAHPGRVPAASTMIDRNGISTWERTHSTLVAAVQKEIGLVMLLLIFISTVAIFLILSIFWAMVSEKTKDVGTLRAVGASRFGIASIWLSYGLCIGILGAIIGSILGSTIVWNVNPIHEWLGQTLSFQIWDPSVYYLPEIPSNVEPWKVAVVAAGAMIFSVLGALIPALRAANMDPVRALRFE